jgi:endonuclease III
MLRSIPSGSNFLPLLKVIIVQMARQSSTTAAMVAPRRSARNVKREIDDTNGEDKTLLNGTQEATPPPSAKRIKRESSTPRKPKLEDLPSPSPTKKRKEKKQIKAESSPEKQKGDKQLALQNKKLSSYTHNTSPFPQFSRPTPSECRLAHKILASIHGDRVRPEVIKAPKDRAGCGDSPNVLDALVRTILSQNTSDVNSTRAKKSMDKVYGEADDDGMEDRWRRIAEGGQPKLEEAIRSGGLANTKSRVIIDILHQVHDRHGSYSLDHLLLPDHSDDECMREMLSLKGVGPKTASCVLLFCLRRESFAVDTHVHRITGLLGWRPPGSSRDEAHAHLDARIPGEEKYALHVLLVTHGKRCDECKAGGKNLGKCELRKAFRKGKIAGEAGEDVKEEELEEIKHEQEEV